MILKFVSPKKKERKRGAVRIEKSKNSNLAIFSIINMINRSFSTFTFASVQSSRLTIRGIVLKNAIENLNLTSI